MTLIEKLAEQLVALPVLDTLKHAAIPANLSKLPFVNADGTWNETTGWNPAGFEEARVGGNHSGCYLNTGQQSGNYAIGKKKTSGSLSTSKRQFELWLFMDGSAELTGYQFLAVTASGGTVQFILRKWAKNVETLLWESAAGQTFAENDSIYLSKYNGVVMVWRRKGEALPELLGEVEDKTYVKGNVGFGGNGSNPKFINFVGGELKEVGSTESKVAVRRSFPPDQMAVRVDPPSGRPTRWAEDERNGSDVLADITLADEMPGGYSAAGGTLARDPRATWGDIQPFSKVKFYQPGVNIVFDGYLDKVPNVSGDRMSLAPAVVGNQKHLEGNKAIKLGFIDADLTKWGDPSAERRKRLNETNIDLTASVEEGLSSLDPTGTAAGVVMDFTNVEAPGVTRSQAGEADYYGEGIDIGEVRYDYRQITAFAKAVEWATNVALGLTDVFSTFIVGTDHDRTTALEQKVSSSGASGYKYARVRDLREPTGGLTPLGDITAFQNIKVLANHGILPVGTWPNIGYNAQQMLRYAIPLFAAPLRVTTDSIEDDGYISPHAWYPDSNLGDVVRDISKCSLFDWFVYNELLFQFRLPGSYGRLWKAYVGESELDELGLDSERLWESIVVQYTDVDGTTRTVGPVGSAATVEDDRLRITDPDHPAVRAELTRRDILDLHGIGSPEIAIAVGQRFLEEANLLSRSGSATLSHYVMDDKGIWFPVAQVKSGDWISFVDASDKSYRKIVGKTYAHTNRGSEIDVDAPPSGLEALLERLQAGLITLGLS